MERFVGWPCMAWEKETTLKLSINFLHELSSAQNLVELSVNFLHELSSTHKFEMERSVGWPCMTWAWEKETTLKLSVNFRLLPVPSSSAHMLFLDYKVKILFDKECHWTSAKKRRRLYILLLFGRNLWETLCFNEYRFWIGLPGRFHRVLTSEPCFISWGGQSSYFLCACCFGLLWNTAVQKWSKTAPPTITEILDIFLTSGCSSQKQNMFGDY